MTLVEHDNPRGTGHHIGELRLRRFRLGELPVGDSDEITRHTTECGPCRARLKTIEDEQRQFERDISFERFAGGVERARRVPRVHPRRLWTVAAVGFAAAAALVLVLRPAERNRIKGVAPIEATIRIAAADGRAQRAAAAGSTHALRAGERVRLGYRTNDRAHLVAVSIDDAGVVTPLYPEPGKTLSVEPGREVSFMPDSLVFTGQGRERVFVLLSEGPLAVDQVAQAARAAHAKARGDLEAVQTVPVQGRGQIQQFTWLFEKP